MKKEDGNSLLDKLEFRPNLAGHQYDDLRNSCPKRIISDFEIIYFVGGRCTVTIKDVKYECAQGDIMLICPYEEHIIESSKEDPHDNFWVHFELNPSYLQNEFTEYLFPGSQRKRYIGINDMLIGLYSRMLMEIHEKRDGYLALFGHYFSVIMLNIARSIRDMEKNKKAADSAIKINGDIMILGRAESYILENFASSITVTDICRTLCISQSYLFLIFKKYLKISPMKYLNRTRLKRALYLIINSRYSIKEIASMTGFSDPFYFSRSFKKMYGTSPSEYSSQLKY